MFGHLTLLGRRAGRSGLLQRLLVGLLGLLTGFALVPPAAGAEGPPAPAAEQQVLTWKAGNSVTEYLAAPETAVAGPATIIFDNSVAAGNTTGMPHTLTFDVSTPGYNHDVDLNLVANPYDSEGGYYEAEVVLTPGVYRYHCVIPGHGSMVGELVVTGDGGGTDPDETAPEITANLGGDQDDDGAYIGGVEVTIVATDADSGVDSVEYSLDGGEFLPYDAPVTVAEEGEHTLDYRATDVAGNVAEDSVTFTVVADTSDPDETAPELAIEVAGEQDAGGAYVGGAEVTLSATDADSGVDSIEYSLDGAEFTHYHAPVVVDEEGEHTLEARATDVAGNVAEESVTFTVVSGDVEPDPDETAPELAIEVAGEQDAGGAYVGGAEVTVVATDADSGVDSVEYSLDGGEFAAYEAPIAVDEEGEHTLEARATDVAGNVAEESVTFTVAAGDVDPDPGECPDTRETVVIGDLDTGVANADLGDGCTINDRIDETGDYATNGAFVRHVSDVVHPLAAEGILSQREADAIIRAAIRSQIGR